MITVCRVRMTLLASLIALAGGCSREQQDWQSAESADTSEGYSRFLEQHTDSELAKQARARIAQIQEDHDWQHTDSIATVEAYRQFIALHPHGKWTEEARIRIEGFSLGSAPHDPRQGQVTAGRSGVRALQLASGAAVAAGSAEPVAEPQRPVAALTRPAASVPGDEAQAAPATQETRAVATTQVGNGYGVQLGAFGSQASADHEWQRLQDRFGPQLHGMSPRIVVASTGSGQLYRLQAPAAGEAQARALCDSLKQQAQACVPVLPR
jgi:SPOR domain